MNSESTSDNRRILDLSTKLLLAFVGAYLTVIGSVYILSRQREMSQSAETEKRDRERENVSRALLVEIHQVNSAVYYRLRYWNDPSKVDPEEWLPPLSPFFTDAYDGLGSRIGELDADLAQAVVEYHGYISFINEFQTFADEYAKQDKSVEFYRRYRRLLRNHLAFRGEEKFREFYNRYNLKWPEDAIDPDELIAQAKALIEEVDAIAAAEEEAERKAELEK